MWSDKSRHDRGYGKEWDKLRIKILRRDEYICQCSECRKEGRLLPATEVDHIIPKSKDGTDDEDNLQAINKDCHKRKTQRETGRKPRYGCTPDGIPLDPEHHWAAS